MREAFKNIAKHICAKHFCKSIAYTVNFANAIIDLSHRPAGVSAWRPPGLSATPPQGSLEQLFHCASVAHALREAHFWISQVIQLASEPCHLWEVQTSCFIARALRMHCAKLISGSFKSSSWSLSHTTLGGSQSSEQQFHCANATNALREGRLKKVTMIGKQTCPHCFL